MSDPHDKPTTPPGNAPSWVDEVLSTSTPDTRSDTPLSGPADLKIPGSGTPEAAQEQWSADEWVARATGGPVAPARAASPFPASSPAAGSPQSRPEPQPWPEPQRPQPVHLAPPPIAQDVAQKKLIAGLLAIFLGGLGIHKFYLGMNNPGIVMLAITLGASFFGMPTLLFGIGFLLIMLTGVVSLIGLIEGIIYLTKSDADFTNEYLIGKKPWF